MNITLNDWNKSCVYANKVCKKLNCANYTVKAVPYTMYDGDKGLYLQVFDANGNFFTQYASGIRDNYLAMKTTLDNLVLIIKRECK